MAQRQAGRLRQEPRNGTREGGADGEGGTGGTEKTGGTGGTGGSSCLRRLEKTGEIKVSETFLEEKNVSGRKGGRGGKGANCSTCQLVAVRS